MDEYTKGKIVEKAMENGIETVVILEGKAPEQHNNKCVEIKGNIDSPSRFVKVRGDDFDDCDRHCLVNVDGGEIKLVINPQSSTDKHTIIGKIQKSKKFVSLGINDNSKSYSPEDLHRKLKLMRSYFPDISSHTAICKELKNLTATIQREIEDHDDERGNVSQKFKQTVESNVPKEFIMSIPLIEGEDPVDVAMSINLRAGGTATILCYLESMDAADLIEETFKKRIEEEVAELQEWVVIIEH